jgi:hypothetical protein
MREETLLGVPDEGIRIKGEAAQDPKRSGSQRSSQHVPEHVGAESGGHRGPDGECEIHMTGAGQDTGSEQHGDGRGRQPPLHGQRPGEEHGHAVRDEQVGYRGHEELDRDTSREGADLRRSSAPLLLGTDLGFARR